MTVEYNFWVMLAICSLLALIAALLENGRLSRKLTWFTGRGKEPLFVMIAHGDGARCWIVPESKLHEELHDCYCIAASDHKWENCRVEGVLPMVLAIDEDDSWTRWYPDYERFSYADHGEDYRLEIVRLS